MKNLIKPIILVFTVISLIFPRLVSAQSPEMMSYQAIVRDQNNSLVVNQLIGMQISVLQDNTPVYVETHNPSTNENGLVSLEIGNGYIVSGTFENIDWTVGPYFIKTETDLSGGTSYTISGTSQILSVAYALHSKTAESLTSTTSERYVGEFYGGGIIYYIDETGEHGLILSLDDVSTGYGEVYSNILDEIGSAAQDPYDGAGNTAAIIAQSGHTNSAALLCENYSNDGFSDWYLPSIFELRLINNSLYIVNKALYNDGDENTNPINVKMTLGESIYWSSTEIMDQPTSAWYFSFHDCTQVYEVKPSFRNVRAIRAF